MFLVKFVAPLAIAFLFALGVYSKVITLFPFHWLIRLM